MTSSETTLSERIDTVRERITASAARSGRSVDYITLLAVTKRVEPERIRSAIALGIGDCGENYVQEAQSKIGTIGQSVRWHLIGHLQRNKAKSTVGLFSLIQSVDSYQLAQELDKAAAKIGIVQDVLIEVNIAGSENRAGVLGEAALELADRLASLPHLKLCGLMGIAPFAEDSNVVRPYFRGLKSLFDRLPTEYRQTLSMGMSGDFETAIEEGSTLVRIGTAIFGQRV